MSDNWSLKDKWYRANYEYIKVDDIEILRQKIIEDINEIFSDFPSISTPIWNENIINKINKRFGVE